MLPSTKTPELQLDLINDTKWNLRAQNPESFTLLYFYRGYHCPVCKKQLEDVTKHLQEFSDKGVNVIAISMDSEKRAKKTAEEWDIETLPLAYGLSEKDARDWGLYISSSISDKEPEMFSEPGVFLIKTDGTLYFSSVQTMPFARPDNEDILNALDFILAKDYPARGAA